MHALLYNNLIQIGIYALFCNNTIHFSSFFFSTALFLDRDAPRHSYNHRREVSATSKEPRLNHVNHNNNITQPSGGTGIKDRKHSGSGSQFTADTSSDSFVSTVLTTASSSSTTAGSNHTSSTQHVPHHHGQRPARSARPHQFKDYIHPAPSRNSPN